MAALAAASSPGLDFRGLKPGIPSLFAEFMGFIFLLSAPQFCFVWDSFLVKVMSETHFHKVAFSVVMTFWSRGARSSVSARGADLEVGAGLAVLLLPAPRSRRCWWAGCVKGPAHPELSAS